MKIYFQQNRLKIMKFKLIKKISSNSKLINITLTTILLYIFIYSPTSYSQDVKRLIHLNRKSIDCKRIIKAGKSINKIVPSHVVNIFEPSDDDISLELNLDWTSCQIHRVADSSPIDIILNGTINSNCAEIWTLSAIEPIPGSLPNLFFVNDIFGDDYGNGWLKIGLQWQISIDGGTFEPMNVSADNSISYIFPPGNHTFQVKITGDVKYYQEDGYYKLKLQQSFSPQM